MSLTVTLPGDRRRLCLALLALAWLFSSTSASVNSRDTTPIAVCRRWSHQSQIVNGTLYIYGGRAISEADQTDNEWNDDFLSVDLTKTWQISAPAVQGLPRPSGPPAVANGFLWASYDTLFLYGGEFQDRPAVSPDPSSMWQYSIATSNWQNHGDPQTSSGTNAPSNNVLIQRAAEGAGFSVPALGRGWYFGGHEDGYTVAGWAQSVPRIYLTSLLEYTFPGRTNKQVSSLQGGSLAPSGGAWRNITEGALSDQAGFPERADGVLVYVPGFGQDGLLLGLAGGTNATFTQTNIIDVYDIATSTWYKQATSGPSPKPRVNPCAVVAAAADGSSYQVYMFGGQNLIPAGEQTQYDDMWILSVPSFTWMQVDTSNQSTPPGRSGHTCHIWDSQMIVVGGYVTDLSCDYPGIYVFDTSKLEWTTSFTATSNAKTNVFSQQVSQLGNGTALQGSFGYQVPALVRSAIGGGATGGATAVSPVATATTGPLASGTPLIYPGDGSSAEAGSGGNTGDGSQGNHGSRQDHVGAIAAGVVAGVAGLIALYLAFVALIYRRRVREYNHNVSRYGWTPILEQDETGEKVERGRGRGQLFSGAGAGAGARGRSDKNEALLSSQTQMGAGGGAGRPGPMRHRASSRDLLGRNEPTFVGVMLHPRRSLRVTNPD